MSVQIFDFKFGINYCYIIKDKGAIMIDGGSPNIDLIKESWKLIIDGGAKMIFPGHGKPFPVEIIKKHIS